eukprot:TCALIF_12319-PA protein Name:"Protein of unknown function" AED:0.42 eAED:0.42 QI:0/0/0/0.5/1/1/2/0/194
MSLVPQEIEGKVVEISGYLLLMYTSPDMLQRFLDLLKTISNDGTHGTNAAKFVLITVMVFVDMYVASLAEHEKGVACANMALAAIAEKHVGLNLSNPGLDPGVRMSMQGYRRSLGRPATQAKGLTKELLQGFIHQAIGLDIDSNGRKRATLVMWREAWREPTCLLTLARFADLQHVMRRDISVDHLRQVIAIQF